MKALLLKANCFFKKRTIEVSGVVFLSLVAFFAGHVLNDIFSIYLLIFIFSLLFSTKLGE